MQRKKADDDHAEGAVTSKPVPSMSYKDYIAIGLSVCALSTSLLSIWLQYFRASSRLNLIITDSFDIAEKYTVGPQPLRSSVNIAFLNDGNRQILIDSISQSISKLKEPELGKVREIYSKYTKSPASSSQFYVEQYTKVAAKEAVDILGDCGRYAGDFGYFNWMAHFKDGRQVRPTATIVKPGEFITLENVSFVPGTIEFSPATTSASEEAFFVSCLRVAYVKSDGSTGSMAVAAALMGGNLHEGGPYGPNNIRIPLEKILHSIAP